MALQATLFMMSYYSAVVASVIVGAEEMSHHQHWWNGSQDYLIESSSVGTEQS